MNPEQEGPFALDLIKQMGPDELQALERATNSADYKDGDGLQLMQQLLNKNA